MKIKTLFFFLAGLLVISVIVNSCKKENQNTVNYLFTTGTWQLASVQVLRYVGSTQLQPTAADTLNTTCDTTQLFTFNTNNTCTYTNFACIPQKQASGTWSVSKDQLFLMANMPCTDTVPGTNATRDTTLSPFAYAKILNLGQYSMVLQTGDIATYYTSTTKRRIVQYGFVHQRASAGN